jgi:hypothetical protein
MVDADLYLLQICATQISSEVFLATVMEKWVILRLSQPWILWCPFLCYVLYYWVITLWCFETWWSHLQEPMSGFSLHWTLNSWRCDHLTVSQQWSLIAQWSSATSQNNRDSHQYHFRSWKTC